MEFAILPEHLSILLDNKREIKGRSRVLTDMNHGHWVNRLKRYWETILFEKEDEVLLLAIRVLLLELVARETQLLFLL